MPFLNTGAKVQKTGNGGRETGDGKRETVIGLLWKPELKGLIAHLRRLKKGDGTVFIALQAMLLIFAPLASAKGAKSSGQDGCI